MKLIWNIVGILIARLCSPIIRMLLFVVVSKQSGPLGLGELQVVVTYFTLFETLSTLGLNSYVTREVARETSHATRYLMHASVLGLSASALLAFVMNLMALGYSSDVRLAMAIMSAAILPSAIVSYSEAVLVALGRARVVPLLLLCENILIVGAGLWVFSHAGSVPELAAAMLVLRFAVAAVAIGVAATIARARFEGFDRTLFGSLLREVPVFLGSTVAWVLYTGMDVLVLSRLRPLSEVGIYTAAARIVTSAQVLPQSVLFTVYPLLAEAFRRSRGRFQHLIGQTGKYLLIGTLPMIVGLTILAPRIVELLFGTGFTRSSGILVPLAWSLAPFVMMKLGGTVLLASNRQVTDLMINWGALALGFVLHVVLITAYGAEGAAYASLGTMLAVCMVRMRAIWPDLAGLAAVHGWRAALVASTTLALALRSLDLVPVAVLIGASVPAYFALLVIFKTFSRADIAEFPGADRLLAKRWLAPFFPPYGAEGL